MFVFVHIFNGSLCTKVLWFLLWGAVFVLWGAAGTMLTIHSYAQTLCPKPTQLLCERRQGQLH